MVTTIVAICLFVSIISYALMLRTALTKTINEREAWYQPLEPVEFECLNAYVDAEIDDE